MTARLSPDEEQRLAALRSYRILDTEADPAFDEITRTIAEICGAPSAMVSLVDERRQWFKSRHNFDLTETPREHAFCDHAIRNGELLQVEDALKDARFAANPLVTGHPNIRFYAGAPLKTADGHALGTLCVIDHKPRKLEPHQSSCLQALSKQVMAQLELRRALAEKERALQQKDLLLKEVNHRVKNGLQMIGSLMQLQKRKITDPVAQQQLSDMGMRIQTLATVHRHLYRHDDLAKAELGAYLREVCKPLANSADVTINVEAPAVLLPVDSLVPLAMIISELVTNSAKYARRVGSRPTVTIVGALADDVAAHEATAADPMLAGSRPEAGRVLADGGPMLAATGATTGTAGAADGSVEKVQHLRISVRDDGPGLPAGFDLDHTTGLGMRVITSLVQQLDGTIAVGPGPGAHFEIDVKMKMVERG